MLLLVLLFPLSVLFFLRFGYFDGFGVPILLSLQIITCESSLLSLIRDIRYTHTHAHAQSRSQNFISHSIQTVTLPPNEFHPIRCLFRMYNYMRLSNRIMLI